MTIWNKRYSDLIYLETFEERFDYLKLGGEVGESTFGHGRFMNQGFYKSTEWLKVRRDVILRDGGCDLGTPGLYIYGDLLVHHINPLTPEDFERGSMKLLSMENLITTTPDTHNAIHFGGEPPRKEFVERRPGDTKLW